MPDNADGGRKGWPANEAKRADMVEWSDRACFIAASTGNKRRMIGITRRVALLAVIASCLASVPAGAERAVDPARWHDVKCVRYGKAWTQALAHQGLQGLGQAFLDAHAAFLASNCTRRADVCARSPEELKLANTMVVLSMNAGTASTFPPFYCR